jgi:hypothetical protein
MQVNFNNVNTQNIFEDFNSEDNNVNLNLSQSIIDLQKVGAYEINTVDSNASISAATTEKRRIFQRVLNLQDAASDLRSYIREFGNELTGTKATDTSTDSIDISFGDEKSAITSVTNLSSLTSGTFSINGVQITVDTDTDSIIDVLDKINDSDAAVKATYDYSEQTVSITSLRNRQMLLETGSSNFLSSANLHEGYIAGDLSNSEEEFLKNSPIQTLFSRFTGRFNRLMNSNFELAEGSTFKEALVDLSKDAVKQFIDPDFNSGIARLASDIKLNFDSGSATFLNSTISFQDDDNSFNFYNFLSSSKGLLSPLVSLTKQADSQLQRSLSSDQSVSLIINKTI